MVSANCLTCHAGTINGQLVVGLGAADGDFTGNQAQYIDAAGSLITDPTEQAEFQRFDARISRRRAVREDLDDRRQLGRLAHRRADGPPRSDDARVVRHAAARRADGRRARRRAAVVAHAEEARDVLHGRGAGRSRADHDGRVAPVHRLRRRGACDRCRVRRHARLDRDAVPAEVAVSDRRAARRAGQAGVREDVLALPRHVRRRRHVSEPPVPADVVATDPSSRRHRREFSPDFIQWFASSFWGETSRLSPQKGYVAPPLDGIWATAPFFHNGSVPTIAAVLDSSKRPTYWARTSYDSTDFDQAAVGWNYTALTTARTTSRPRRACEDLRHDAPGLRQRRAPVRRRALGC